MTTYPLNGLAWIMRSTGRLEEAEVGLRENLVVAREHPSAVDLPQALEELARFLSETKRLDEAVPLLMAAIEVLPLSQLADHARVHDPL